MHTAIVPGIVRTYKFHILTLLIASCFQQHAMSISVNAFHLDFVHSQILPGSMCMYLTWVGTPYHNYVCNLYLGKTVQNVSDRLRFEGVTKSSCQIVHISVEDGKQILCVLC